MTYPVVIHWYLTIVNIDKALLETDASDIIYFKSTEHYESQTYHSLLTRISS